MNEKEFQVIQEAKRIMEDNGILGIQFMQFKNGIAVFEGFGKRKDEYVNYIVDIEEAIENEEIIIKRVNILVEVYEEDGEIDVTINTWTWDNNMEEIDFQDETVKTYKRMDAAVKRAKQIVQEIMGANLEIVRL